VMRWWRRWPATRCWWRTLGVGHPMAAHRIDSVAIAQTGSLPDSAEGVEAFLAKRPAQWSGHPSTDTPPWWPNWDEPTY